MVANKTKSVSLISIVVIIRMLLTYVPFVNYHCPEIIKLFTIITLYTLLLFNDKGFFRHCIYYLPVFIIDIYSFTILYYYPVVKESLPVVLYAFVRPLSWALVGYYYLNYASDKDARKLLLWLAAFYVITAITTCIGCTIFPNASRLLATGMEEDTLYHSLFMNYNIGGFSFVYSMVLFTPLIVCAYREKLFNRLVCVGLLILILLTILFTEYTTALIFYVSCFVLAFVPKNCSTMRLGSFLIAIVLIILLIRPILADVLYMVSDNMDREQIAMRLREIADSLSGVVSRENTDLEARTERWDASWRVFLSNPVFGNGVKGGGHSFILDNMARYGISGVIGLVIMFASLYRKCVCVRGKNNFYIYFFFCFLVQLGLAVVNPKVFSEFFTLVLPLFYLTFISPKTVYENSLDH